MLATAETRSAPVSERAPLSKTGIGWAVQSRCAHRHQPCWKRCPECNAKLSTRLIRELMARSPWQMFATYVKGGWDRSANAASYSYVLHAPQGPSISVMRSENE